MNPFDPPLLSGRAADTFGSPAPPALDPYRTYFVAEITGRTTVSGVNLYDWEEQTFDRATALPTAANPRRSGGYVGGEPVHPAVELNNAVVNVGAVVFMRQKGVVNGQTYYEFASPNGTTCLSVIEDYRSEQQTVLPGAPNGSGVALWFDTYTRHVVPSGTYLVTCRTNALLFIAGETGVIRQLMLLRFYDETRNVPVSDHAVIAGSLQIGGAHAETTVEITQVVVGPCVLRVQMYLPDTNTSDIAAFDGTALGQTITSTATSSRGATWRLVPICAHEEPESGAGPGSGCTQNPTGWEGEGYYWIAGSEDPVSIEEGEQCGVVILCGRFDDEAEALAAAADCFGDPPEPPACGEGTQACSLCPLNTSAATAASITVSGHDDFASVPVDFLNNPDEAPNGIQSQTTEDLRTGSGEGWFATLFGTDNGEGWRSDMVGPGGFYVAGTLLDAECNAPDGPIVVMFSYDLSIIGATLTITWTLT